MPRKLSISPELKALSHTLDALDWASSVDSNRVDDVQRVCGFAADEARDILLGDLAERSVRSDGGLDRHMADEINREAWGIRTENRGHRFQRR